MSRRLSVSGGIVPLRSATESDMITLENWRERMAEDMRLRDLRQRTVDGYLLAVRLFLDRTGVEPEAIGEEDIRAYFLNLRDDWQQAPEVDPILRTISKAS